MSNVSKVARPTKADFAAETAAGKAEQLAAAREQAAEIKAKREAQAAAHAAEQAKPAAATPEELGIGIELDFEIPSWKRVLVGFVLGVASAGAVGYGIGMVAAYCIAGILTLTTSAGIALFMSFLVWLLAIYASWKIGGYVAGKVFSSVVLPDGLASRAAASVSNAASGAKSTVSGWFTSSKDKVQAKFSGAHKVAAAS